MWEMLNTLLSIDHLTPQGYRLGIASFFALRAIAPGRASIFEIAISLLFSVAASILVAQAVSL